MPNFIFPPQLSTDHATNQSAAEVRYKGPISLSCVVVNKQTVGGNCELITAGSNVSQSST